MRTQAPDRAWPPVVSRPTSPVLTVSPPTASPSAPCHPYPLPALSPKGREFYPLLPHWHGPPLCSLCSLPPLLCASAAVGTSCRLSHRSGSNKSTVSPSPSHHRSRARGPSLEPTEPQRRPDFFLRCNGLTRTTFSSRPLVKQALPQAPSSPHIASQTWSRPPRPLTHATAALLLGQARTTVESNCR
jgi:hypothetical protein